MKQSQHNPSRIVNAWCLYDVGNSAFATTIMAAMLPLYFGQIAALMPDGTAHPLALSLWGYTSAVAMLFVAFISLIMGPLADERERKKTYLTTFMSLGAVSTALLALTGTGHWPWVALLYILGSIGFAGSEIFYDALLPHIAPPDQVDRISTRAYAMGYLGGGVLLVINLACLFAMTSRAWPAAETAQLWGMRIAFVSVAIWWILFTLPLMKHVPEPHAGPIVRGPGALTVALRRLSITFRDIRRYRPLFLFLLAFWFYNDGIGTIIKMAVLYGNNIGIGTLDLVGALVVTQFVGVPASFAFGSLAGRLGTKQAILLGISVYCLIAVSGYFMKTPLHFWLLAGTVGLVQGGTQALSRSLFASMVPKTKSAEFFGFYNISGKFAGVAGPAVFAVVNQLTQSGRLAVFSLLVFFVIGGLLLMKVDVQAGRAQAAQ